MKKIILLLLLALALPARAAVVTFTPDGRLLAGDEAGHVELWQLGPDTMVHRWDVGRPVDYIVAAPDGKRFAVATDDRKVAVFNLATFERTALLKGATAPIGFAADNTIITGRGKQRGLVLWQGQARLSVVLADQAVYDVSPDGSIAATAKGGYEIRLWSLRPRIRLLCTVKSVGWGGMGACMLGSDGRYVMALGSTISKPPDGFADVFDVHTGKGVAYVSTGRNAYSAASHGTVVALVGELEGGGAITVEDVSTRKVLWAWNDFVENHPQFGQPTVVAVSPDHLFIATSGKGQPVRIWDARSGKLLSTLVMITW